MPRRRKRFSKLEYALKKAKGATLTDGDLKNYSDFRNGIRKIKVVNKVPPGEARQRRKLSLAPFCVLLPGTATAGDRYAAFISAYSLVGANRLTGAALGRDTTGLGWDAPDAANQSDKLYYPALFKPTMTRTGAVAGNSTSAVTGNVYRYTPRRTFGIPFGRAGATPATDAELTRSKAIATAAASVPAVLSVGFEPEDFQFNTGGGARAFNDAAATTGVTAG